MIISQILIILTNTQRYLPGFQTFRLGIAMTQPNSIPAAQSRIVALDYLRVLAVGVLFLFHLGMIWVPDWGFHFKQESTWTWLKHVLLITSPWRMGLLWFVAGTSLYVMQTKYGLKYLLTKRSNAILLPLFFGLLFVVPIQLYVEMTQQGAIQDTLSVFMHQFYFGPNNYFNGYDSGVWHHIDVNHLWFLRSLWYFALTVVIFHIPITYIRKYAPNFNWLWLTILILLSLWTMEIESSDTKRDIYGFSCFLLGYLYGSSAQFWQWLQQRSNIILIVAVMLMLTYQLTFAVLQTDGQEHLASLFSISYYSAKIFVLLAVLVIANRLFTTPIPLISEANRYVFPFYVIHQSVLVYVAYVVSSLITSEPNTFLFMSDYISLFTLVLTFLVSAAICFSILVLCRYIPLLGMVLGKQPNKTSFLKTKSVHLVVSLVTLPLAAKLLGLI